MQRSQLVTWQVTASGRQVNLPINYSSKLLTSTGYIPPTLYPRETKPIEFVRAIHSKLPGVRLTVAGAGSTIPWTYNQLHDLESLWWVATWIVTNNCFQKWGKSPSDLHATPESIRATLFPPTLLDSNRKHCFTLNFPSKAADIPQTHQPLFEMLDYLREHLIKHYQDIESTLPDSINLDVYISFSEIHSRAQLRLYPTTLWFLFWEKREKIQSEKGKSWLRMTLAAPEELWTNCCCRYGHGDCICFTFNLSCEM